MDRYAQLYLRALLPAWERGVRRRPTLDRWKLLERTQWESRAGIRAIQLSDLRRLLGHAERRVPYWRELFRKSHFEPWTLRGVDDLAALPLLTKDVIRERYADLTDPRTRGSHVAKHTSGSSGDPLSFEYDLDSESWRQAVKLRGWGWSGYRPGARALFYWGVPVRAAGGRALKVAIDRALRRERYVDCLAQDEASLAAAVRAIREHRPEFLIGYSVATAYLARYVEERGLRDWPDITVIGAAEKLGPRERELLSGAFGPRVFDTYGSRETMLLAAECEAHRGLHTMDDTHVVEIVKDGRAARPGEVGEVVVTDLHNFGMPLIRYANGDLAEAGDDGPCACGRGLRRIADLTGRTTETLRTASGQAVSGMVVASALANLPHTLREIQVVQRVSGEIVVRVVPGPGLRERELDAIVAVVRAYVHGQPVRVEKASAIDRGPSGKHRLVVVERPSPEPPAPVLAAL